VERRLQGVIVWIVIMGHVDGLARRSALCLVPHILAVERVRIISAKHMWVGATGTGEASDGRGQTGQANGVAEGDHLQTGRQAGRQASSRQLCEADKLHAHVCVQILCSCAHIL
jgi:hypothetical protein